MSTKYKIKQNHGRLPVKDLVNLLAVSTCFSESFSFGGGFPED